MLDLKTQRLDDSAVIYTEARRPLPLPSFRGPLFRSSASLSASKPPGPSDFDRAFLEPFADCSGADNEFSLFGTDSLVVGMTAMDLRERRSRAVSDDILAGLQMRSV